MATEHQCPSCGAVVPLDDIHVANDTALCRACGKSHSYAALVSLREYDDVDLSTPPKGIRRQSGAAGAQRLIYGRVSPVAMFLVPFTCIWAGGSLGGIYGSQLASGEFDATQSLFGLPFLFGSIVLCAVTAYVTFGKTIITLARGQGTVFDGVGPFGRRRTFRYSRDTIVRLRKSDVQVNDVPQEGVSVEEDGTQQIIFGTMMKDDAKRYVAAFVQEQVRTQRS